MTFLMLASETEGLDIADFQAFKISEIDVEGFAAFAIWHMSELGKPKSSHPSSRAVICREGELV